MKHQFFAAVLSFTVVLFSGCSDILERDLDGFGVSLIAPPDNHSTSSNVVAFRWEAVPQAAGYRIQIATPNIANAVTFLVDSVITTTSFSFPLPPAAYSWRVRAENANSATGYSERSLVVLESNSLDGLTPILQQPGSNAAVRNASITFSWSALTGAEDYRFEVREGTQTGALVLAQLVEGTTVSLNDLAEGTYSWGVQGQNATSTSAFSYRSLRVDRTAPTTPVLLTPAANSTLPNTETTFSWQSGADLATGTRDSLFILTTTQEPVRSLLATSTSYTDSLGTGSYTWFVRTIDDAGNASSSAARSLTIQ
jgi:hypothetical protein